MLQFNKVILHNFGSYGHAEVELKDRGFCLVSGRNNYQKDNALSNGSGKSFLWSAICFAITGETINGLHSNLRNINAPAEDKDAYVTLDFNSDADNYKLTRVITPSTNLTIEKNGEDVSGKGVKNSEKQLALLLPDINKDLIASTIIIGQGMPNKFSSFSPSERKALLERLTKSDYMLDDVKRRVKERSGELNTQARSVDDCLLVNETKLRTISNSLSLKQQELDNFVVLDYKAEIDKLTKTFDQNNLAIAELNGKLDLIRTTEYPEASKAFSTISDAKLKEISTENESFQEVISRANEAKSTTNAQLAIVRNKINQVKNITDVCPYCHRKLDNVTKPDITEDLTQEAQLENHLNEIQAKLNQVNNIHRTNLQALNEKYNAESVRLKSELDRINTTMSSLQSEVLRATNTNMNIKVRIGQLETESEMVLSNHEKLIKDVEQLTADKKKIEAEIGASTASKTELSARQAVIKKMETLLTRDFRGYLLKNVIDFLDKKAKEYSKIVFDTDDLNVYLDGNALDISYCGKMFDNLSGGEKQRVDLILQFSIRDMLNSYLNMNSNILVLDEITDFLDKKSCKAIMKLIETELSSVESVFIISHHVEELDIPVDSEIHIVKNEDGISEVV